MFHSRPSYSGASAASASAASAAASSSFAAAAAAASSSSFSSSSASTSAHLDRALVLNAEYASFLRAQLDSLSSLLAVNAEKQRLVAQIVERNATQQAEVDASAPPKRDALINRTAIFAAPFFVDSQGATPPPNPDTLRKQRLRGSMPAEHKFVPWTSLEKFHLDKAVRTQNQKHIIKQAMEQAKSQLAAAHDPAALRSTLATANSRMQGLKPEEYDLTADDIDWNHVARYVRSRSAVECKIQWSGVEDPRINHAVWTPAEHKRLVALAAKYDNHSWLQVAKELDTNRTAMQCFREFQTRKQPKQAQAAGAGKWTDEEDALLVKLVEEHGERDWRTVALHLPHKTNRQCMMRWLKSTDPSIRSGRWTTEESLRLLLTVQSYGLKMKQDKSKAAAPKKRGKKDAAAAAAAAAGEAEVDAAEEAAEKSNELTWAQAQLHIPGRTDVKCREHWPVIDPALNKGDWTEEEDARLRALVLQHQSQLSASGGSQPMPWSRIAKELGNGRTDSLVALRWKKLVKGNEPAAAATAKQAAAGGKAPGAALAGRRGGAKATAARNQVPPPPAVDRSAMLSSLPALASPMLSNFAQQHALMTAAASTPQAFAMLAALHNQFAAATAAAAAAAAASAGSSAATRPVSRAVPFNATMPPVPTLQNAHFGHAPAAAAASAVAAAAAAAASSRVSAGNARPASQHISSQEQLYAQQVPTLAPGSPTLRGQSVPQPLGRPDDQSSSSLLRSPHVMSLRAPQLASSAQLLHSPHHGASQHAPAVSLDDFSLLHPDAGHYDDDAHEGAHHGLRQDSGRHDFHHHPLDSHAHSHLMLEGDDFATQHAHAHADSAHAAQQHSMHGSMMGAHDGPHDDDQGDPHDPDSADPSFSSEEYGAPVDEGHGHGGHHQFLDFQPHAEQTHEPPAVAAAASKRKNAQTGGGRKRSKHNAAEEQN